MLVVFGIMIAGVCIAFVYTCYRYATPDPFYKIPVFKPLPLIDPDGLESDSEPEPESHVCIPLTRVSWAPPPLK